MKYVRVCYFIHSNLCLMEFCCCSVETNLTCVHEGVGSIPGLSGLGIRYCRGLYSCGSQTWLGSGVAVAMVETDRYSSNTAPSLQTPICQRYNPKKKKKKKKKMPHKINLPNSLQQNVKVDIPLYPGSLCCSHT